MLPNSKDTFFIVSDFSSSTMAHSSKHTPRTPTYLLPCVIALSFFSVTALLLYKVLSFLLFSTPHHQPTSQFPFNRQTMKHRHRHKHVWSFDTTLTLTYLYRNNLKEKKFNVITCISVVSDTSWC